MEKKTAYEVMTDRIIGFIEKENTLPWHKPWASLPAMYQQNFKTGTVYKGINALVTAMQGFSSPYWLTFKNIQDLGGHLLKGSKHTPVIAYQPATERIRKIKENTKLSDEEKEERIRKCFGFYKVFYVFNGDQTTGIDFPEREILEPVNNSPITEAERVVAEMPNAPKVLHKDNDRAYYHPRMDFVNVPEIALFHSAEEYYSTLFHELGHSTGHQSRLGRFTKDNDPAGSGFASKDYSKEELVAELTASFTLNELGIGTVDTERNSIAYLQGWLNALKENPTWLIQSMNKAVPAVHYIFGREG